MDREFGLYRSHLKGCLFEIIILELLRKNNFYEVQVAREPEDRVREIRPGFIEFKGRGCWHQIETQFYYLQSRYYDPELGRFINADSYASTGQGVLGNNMFAYCLNSPIMGIDLSGARTYFINGIHNPEEEDEPQYAKDFCDLLTETGEDAIPIPVYNGQKGTIGYLVGFLEVFLEWWNIPVYSFDVAQYINNDLKANPLAEGETLNIIGYSGGGQIALNVMELLPEKFDNVILIGAPILDISYTTTKISRLYSTGDIISWNISLGYDVYCVGEFGHDGYFSSENINDIVSLVCSIIK